MRIACVLLVSCLCFTVVSRPEDRLKLPRDGQHDWDVFFGSWKMHLRSRPHRLAGSNEWVEYECHDVLRKVWNGRANLDELEGDGPAGHIEGLTLRLYDPATRQWRIYWANSATPALDVPMIGGFQDGRGEFYDQELYRGRSIFVRFLWTNISDHSGDFEQAFSPDGGKTWEPNWITTMEPENPSTANIPPNPDKHDGQHDFDFEFGTWKAHLKRLLHPLSGSNEWAEYDGNLKVSKIWNGRANLSELDVKNETGHIEGLSLRLFNPKSRQWALYWANANDGQIGVPSVGGFHNGRGEFLDQELIDGRWVLVRFLFTVVSKDSTRGEQAFSIDQGKTWETNWIGTFTR